MLKHFKNKVVRVAHFVDLSEAFALLLMMFYVEK